MSKSMEQLEHSNVKTYTQWFAAFAALLVKIQLGVQYGWISPNISRLTGENSPIPTSPEEASWLVSLTALSGFVTVIIPVFSIERLGSRKTIILSLVIFLISHTCLICASSIEMLYAARIFGGVAVVFGQSAFCIYVGEVAAPKIRGTLISVSTAGSGIGNMFGAIAETYLQMKISSSIYLAMCIVNIIFLICLKDSPYYFVKKNDFKNAKISIDFYRGDDKENKIFEDVKKYIDAQFGYTFKDKLRDFRLPVTRKSMILVTIIGGMSNLCGQTIITGYMETILKSAKITLVKPQEFVIYANVLSIVSSLLSVKLTDRIGRRILLIISSVGVTVTMTLLGTYFYLLKANYDLENLQWVPLFAIIFYLLALYIGFLPVPYTILSELFPEHLKSIAALILMLSVTLNGFIIGKTYQPMVTFVGEVYVFWMYAAVALIAIPCALFLMPETKNKSFQEIQEMLK